MTLYDRVWWFKERHPALGALAIMPWRTAGALSDPIRRRHLVVQFAQVYGAAYVWTRSWWRALGITLTYFGVYEFVLEPATSGLMRRSLELRALAAVRPLSRRERAVAWLGRYSWVGPYFERGPRAGETLVRA